MVGENVGETRRVLVDCLVDFWRVETTVAALRRDIPISQSHIADGLFPQLV